MPLGSMALLMVRISSISASLREKCRKGILSEPMPCSAEIEPRRLATIP